MSLEITSIAGLLNRAQKEFPGDDPVLLFVGPIYESINIDNVVVKQVGEINGKPVYEANVRIYEILDDGNIRFHDDHEKWFGAGNPEVTEISSEHFDLCVIAKPATDNLVVPDGVDNVVCVDHFGGGE